MGGIACGGVVVVMTVGFPVVADLAIDWIGSLIEDRRHGESCSRGGARLLSVRAPLGLPKIWRGTDLHNPERRVCSFWVWGDASLRGCIRVVPVGVVGCCGLSVSRVVATIYDGMGDELNAQFAKAAAEAWNLTMQFMTQPFTWTGPPADPRTVRQPVRWS